ncbi:MAG: hypothetical protein M3N59_02605 [bacterium]|nr:hypothetical protein [bacterium]
MPKKITTSRGFWIGVSLLAQVTALLALTALAGFVLDTLFDSAPFGLAGAVIVGSITATIVVVREVYKLTVEEDSPAERRSSASRQFSRRGRKAISGDDRIPRATGVPRKGSRRR